MKTVIKCLSVFVVVVFACSATAAPVNVTLAGLANAEVRDGVRAGFYTLNVDSATLLAMCDDYNTRISVGDNWSAYIYNYADIQAGAGKFNLLAGDEALYSRAGYLMSMASAMSYAEQADLNLAVWNIFTPGSVTMTAYAQILYDTVVTGTYDSFDWSAVMSVLTPNPFGASQEFLTLNKVPVPGTLILLVLGLMTTGLSIRDKVGV
ncbi:MAG: PEP-CTERM sorting domain-containing protein [Parahaliea sp.]